MLFDVITQHARIQHKLFHDQLRPPISHNSAGIPPIISLLSSVTIETRLASVYHTRHT